MSGPSPKPQSPEQQPAGSAGRRRFPATARLLKHADFERVYEQGERHFARHMTFFFLASASGRARVGFTVGRILGEAVDRNRIKRRLREAVRLQLPRLAGAVDIVINPKKTALKAEFEDIIEEVGRGFQVISGQVRNSGGRA